MIALIETALALVVRLTFCAAVAWPERALNVRLPGFAKIVPLLPPVPTVKLTVITVWVPVLGLMARCPVYEPFGRLAALACTDRVAGLMLLTERLVTAIDSQLTSGTIPRIETGLVLAVLRLTVCTVELWPEAALKVRLAGFAAIVPVVLPGPTLKVTVIVVAVPTLGVMVMCPV